MDDSTSKDENGERCVMLFGVNIAAKRPKLNSTVSHSSNTVDENQNEVELCSFDKEGESDVEMNENHDSGQSSNRLNRKKVKQWTKNEHKAFLVGLQTAGKGKWKDISRDYVKTKTSAQVASHAQKFFLRQRTSASDKTKRHSVFDTMLDNEGSNTLSPDASPNHSPATLVRAFDL